jgi:hypothetical protein
MVNLGDEAKDTVSGFTGVVVAKHIYLQGCVRVSLQPPVDKEGKLPEIQTFDEPLLEVINAEIIQNNIVPEDNPPGGPSKYMPKAKPIK